MERLQTQQRSTKADRNQKTRPNVTNATGRRDHLLHLQGMVGNHAVSRLIQTKLTISQPGDQYEREADQVADTVMRMPEPAVAVRNDDDEENITRRLEPGAVQRSCAECAADNEQRIQPKANDSVTQPVQSSVAANIHALNGGGSPLPQSTRAFFEPRFGVDFSHVRVHTDSRAAETAGSIQARAFTVGQHIAFGEGRYEPHSHAGRELLAHELTHVIQQNGSQVQRSIDSPVAQRISHARPALMRRWDPPNAGDCPARTDDAWLEKVVVDQEKAQSVTLYWSNGQIESSICSTGKGQCCVDTPDGVAASVAESKRSGSNCTPITEGSGLPIVDRRRTHNGWQFWNTFHAARAIALHQHHTVTGTPLSHGCVRLPLETAQKIFCGERQNRTMVEVRGYARPDCDEPEVQNEWKSDFRSAGRVTDGEPPDQQRIIEQNRRSARTMLRRAYGRELTDAEIQQGAQGQLQIPRCGTQRALPNVEEYRALPATGAAANVPTDALEILNRSGFSHVGAALARDLAGARNVAAARRVVQSHGQDLWTRATKRAQGATANTDDRPLYWARLQLTRTLRQWDPRFTLTDVQRDALMQDLESASRGMDTISFGRSGNAKRILISGFDPFGLELSAYGLTRASNPSGAAVLALDGRSVRNQSINGVIQGVIFPVRYADFDASVVENVFRPFLSGPNAVDMIMTISMGGIGSNFEVEEYAGRRRQAGIDDNLSQPQAGPSTPAGPGPEFIRGTLPPSVRQSLGRTQPNTEETEVTEIPAGGSGPVHRPSGPTAGSTAVAGSGGGFLSNEIFYRASLLRLQTGSQIPVGHLHTPFLTPGLSSTAFEALRTSIVNRVEQIVTAALPDL
ncbi:MAG TPA: DUF4157 domain-containing protein [Pyrinomonadaceae bacterium]|nr:DUF4157 domain-containing protein [Pyrinomonadaceae bacterium]